MANHTAGTDFAYNVLSELDAQDRKVTWLAESTGIAYATLRRKLHQVPDTFTLREMTAIAEKLSIPLSVLLGAAAEVVAA